MTEHTAQNYPQPTLTPLHSGSPTPQRSPEPPNLTAWQVEPDEYLGIDPRGRHYWLLNKNVFRTTNTGTPEQSTSWIS